MQQLERGIVFRVLRIHHKRHLPLPDMKDGSLDISPYMAFAFIAIPRTNPAAVRDFVTQHKDALPYCYQLMQRRRLFLIRTVFPGANIAIDMEVLREETAKTREETNKKFELLLRRVDALSQNKERKNCCVML